MKEIQDKISDYTIIPERAKLKGIQEEMDVYKVLIGNSQSTMSIQYWSLMLDIVLLKVRQEYSFCGQCPFSKPFATIKHLV